MVLYLARTPPQVCAPTRHNHQFFSICGFFTILAKIFQDPLNAWWVHIPVQLFRKGEPSTQTVFWCNLGQKKIPKILRLNSKGKVTIWPFWDRFSSAKTTFLTWHETSSKHHRGWLKVQRTCLKPFLTSEDHLGRTKSRGRLSPKSGFFGRNFFSAQNCIKRHFKYLLFPLQNAGPVYAPIRHTGCLDKILPKSRVYPQMEKIEGCAWWVHILGVGRGPSKVPYHTLMPYQYQLLTLRQSKVMPSQNKLPKSRFSKGLPLKPSILLLQRAKRLLGEKVTLGPIFKRRKSFLNLLWYIIQAS